MSNDAHTEKWERIFKVGAALYAATWATAGTDPAKCLAAAEQFVIEWKRREKADRAAKEKAPPSTK